MITPNTNSFLDSSFKLVVKSTKGLGYLKLVFFIFSFTVLNDQKAFLNGLAKSYLYVD